MNVDDCESDGLDMLNFVLSRCSNRRASIVARLGGVMPETSGEAVESCTDPSW